MKNTMSGTPSVRRCSFVVGCPLSTGRTSLPAPTDMTVSSHTVGTGGDPPTAAGSQDAGDWIRCPPAGRPWPEKAPSAGGQGAVRRPHDDAGLRRGHAALAAQLADGLVEVRRVAAGQLDDVVEAPGHERHALGRRQPERQALERGGIRRREQAYVDVGGELAPERPLVDARAVPLDRAARLQAPHPLRDGVRAQPDLRGDLREARPSVSDEQLDDPVVDVSGHDRNLSTRSLGVASPTRPWNPMPMTTTVGVPTEIKQDEHRVAL